MKSFLTFELGPMRTYLGILAFLLTMSVAAPAAFAWGDAGHRIVCKIAYLELKPAVRKQVDALIALDPKFRSFAASCVWPDLFPPVRPAEHFINVPREANSIDPERLCPTADRCVASAILNDSRDLAISTNSEDQLRLLKSLGHWVGDIHQPFHVSFEDDKGGTLVTASGHCTANLHLAWDFCIIEQIFGPNEDTTASQLEAEITEADRNEWVHAPVDAAAVASWANESLSIAREPSVQYCVQHDRACWYSADQPQFTGNQRTVDISDQYIEKNTPVVRDRLKRAGVRLAATLNAVFQK